MKKSMQLAAMAFILLLQGHTLAPKQSNLLQTISSLYSSSRELANYTWYDQYFDPTGTVSDISTELNRLRTLYPWYIFSPTPGMGLVQFEFGYHPVLSDVIIYSNYSL